VTTKIGVSGSETTVPDPHRPGYTASAADVAHSERALDGSLNTLFVAAKRRWHVEWRLLTAAQRTSLWTELMRQQHLSWQPPEGGTYTVRVTNPTWRQTASADYAVETDLEEV